jgi:beta-glucanase (GH16 family)
MHPPLLRTRALGLGALLAALILFAYCALAASAAMPAAAASEPDCGSTQIPKQAPASKPAAKKKHKHKKRHGPKKKRSAKKKRKKVAKSAGGDWVCTFSDDFDGTNLDQTKWIAQRTDSSGFTDGGNSCFVDSPNNISVSSGTLRLTSRKEASPLTCNDPYGHFTTQYTSGMVSSWGGRFSQAYGRFEVRARTSSARVRGLQTSFWLWPVDEAKYGGRPASGEIDFAELFSAYADRAVPYIHYKPLSPDPNVTNTSCIIGNPDDFHSYALEWSPTTLTVIYDGKTCLIDTWNPASPLTRPAPFDQPFFILLTQGLGIGNNAFDPATTPLPATTTVDYVRAWK